MSTEQRAREGMAIALVLLLVTHWLHTVLISSPNFNPIITSLAFSIVITIIVIVGLVALCFWEE